MLLQLGYHVGTFVFCVWCKHPKCVVCCRRPQSHFRCLVQTAKMWLFAAGGQNSRWKRCLRVLACFPSYPIPNLAACRTRPWDSGTCALICVKGWCKHPATHVPHSTSRCPQWLHSLPCFGSLLDVLLWFGGLLQQLRALKDKESAKH